MRLTSWLKLDYGLLLALILPLFAIMPLLTHAGLPNTADGPAHLMRQVELNQAWQEGNFYPRWGTDLAFGHGMPIFSYAPPALYQLTQFFHLFGLPLDAAMKGVLVFDFLLYSLGMFLLARRLFGPGPALLAAALYVYAPYRLRESYIQGNYGQFTGLAFYPLILWAFHGLITTGQPAYLVAAAFSLAGLLFSHNISFMLFAPLLAGYLLLLLIMKQRVKASAKHTSEPDLQPTPTQTPPTEHLSVKPSLEMPPASSPLRLLASRLTPYALRFIHPLTSIIVAVLLGLGLSAIFWLPAFGERHEIQLEGITQGFFDFRENFISLPEFFSPPLPLDRAAINPKFPLSLGLPQIIGAGLGLITLIIAALHLIKARLFQETRHSSFVTLRGHSTLPFALFFAFFLLLYAFLALPQSQALWEAIPLLELAEFPWRMLGPAIFCASLLAGFQLSIINNQWSILNLKPQTKLLSSIFHSPSSILHPPSSTFYLLSSIFLTIALNVYYLYPAQFIVWGTPTPADAFAYEISSGAIGTTSTGEFLPRAAQQHPQPDTLWPDYATGRPPQKIDPTSLPAGASVENSLHRSESDIFHIRTPQEFVATVRTLYWPGWQLYLNDQPAAFTVTKPTGLIQTVIPAGMSSLTLKLETTPLRAIGQWLTLGSFVILAIISGMALKQRMANDPLTYTQYAIRLTPHASRLTPQFFAVTTALLIIGYLLSRPLAPLFTLQSNPDRPQSADRSLQVDFGLNPNQTPLLRLVGLDNLPSTLVAPPNGEANLSATLYWRALRQLDTNYAVFLHLDAPNGQTFATVDEVHPENIPTRNWPPGLYLRNSLRLKIPAGLPPIRYEVNVGLYDRQSNQRLAILPGQTTTFNLGSIWLTPPQPDLPTASLAHFGQHITLRQSLYPSSDEQALVLFWQTDQTLDQNYTIFVHLLGPDGKLLAQADGAPYAGLYPLSHWQPGQIITDMRPIAAHIARPAELAAIVVGIYNPATGERLPATDASGQPLPDNSFILPVKP